MDQPAFTITSSATEDDFKEFSRLACKGMYSKSMMALIICIIICTILVIQISSLTAGHIPKGLLENLNISEENTKHLFTFSFILLFSFVFGRIFKFISKYLRNDFVSPNGSFCTETTTTIDAEGLHMRAEHVTSTTKWSGIKKITDHKKIILFYVDNYMAHVFPKHAFESPEEATAFYETALAFFNAAQNPDIHHDETDNTPQDMSAADADTANNDTNNNKDDDHAVVS